MVFVSTHGTLSTTFDSRSPSLVFAIITSFFGIVTGVEFALRSWRLLQPAFSYRPLGGRRWALDATHWILLVVYSFMTGVLIGASVPHEPLVRPLALPSTLFLLSMAFLLLSTGILHHRGVMSPWRISSTPGRYTYAFRPLTYTLVEDVVAVDGGAGRAYRQRLAVRARCWCSVCWQWSRCTVCGVACGRKRNSGRLIVGDDGDNPGVMGPLSFLALRFTVLSYAEMV
jgi:hypothetical protein